MVGSSPLVDFHCHLDLYPDLAAAVRKCELDDVFTLAVTTTPRAWPRNQQLTEATRHVRAALGLHPQLVAERARELSLWEELLPGTRYVGEVGLDAGPRFYRSFDLQKEVFSRVLSACARARNKILTVHSVRATKPVLDLIEECLPSEHGRVVLHWFTGSTSEARRAVELGCYFSINAEMLGNEKRRAVVATLPIDRLLTETDGPFTKIGERPSEPSDVAACIVSLGSVFGKEPATMREAVGANLERLLAEQS